VTYAGGEANVAIALANLGVVTDFVSKLPDNELGVACLNFLRQFGMGTSKVIRGGNRLGIFFLETGAVQRGSKVVYDRSNSSIATVEPNTFDWKSILSDASWFHVTGITPGISKNCADETLEAVKTAKKMGVTVSIDLNYRAKLWKWGKQPEEVMTGIVELANIVVGNEEDAEKVFGIQARGVDVTAGKVDPEKYKIVAQKLKERFQNLEKVAITIRGSVSASHNTWSGVLLDDTSFFTAPKYDITDIVDRVGSGDAFAAGLIYSLIRDPDDSQKALNFATALGCLKHTIPGDAAIVTLNEVEALMSGVASGRVAR
jgi:2-dehydro-3-deoxygluconokinase